MTTCSPQGLIALLTNANFFGNTGKNNNDLGLFDDCIENANSSYFLVDTYFSPQLKVTNGICFEKNCSANELAYAISNFLNTTIAPSVVMATKITGNEGADNIDSSTVGIIFLLFLLLTLGIAIPTFELFTKLFKSEKIYENVKNFESTQETKLEKDKTFPSENLLDDGNAAKLLENKQKNRKMNVLWDFLNCFSLKENWRKLLATRDGPLDFLNGVRAFGFFYVVFGHDYLLRMTMVKNQTNILRLFQGEFFLFVAAAFYAVDVFFWIGGFFLSFVLLDKKNLRQLTKPLTYPFAIVHRYIRIVPSYLIAILICWKIMNLTGSGPLWQKYIDSAKECDYMWRNLLFIDNLFNLGDDDHYCFAWGWYLSNDFQIFFISLFAFFFYGIKPIFGKLIILFMMIGSLAAGLTIIIEKEYGLYPFDLNTFFNSDFFAKYYTKPWCRSPPYLLGILFGMLYKEYVNSKDNNEVHSATLLFKVKNFIIKYWFGKYLFYLYGFFVIFFFTFYPRTYQNDNNAWATGGVYFWEAFQRLIYISGLNLLLMPNFLELKDYIGSILSWKPLSVISKLSFCGYLMHYMIIQRSVYNSRQSIYLNYENVHYFYFTDILLTLFAASILSLFVEIPFINLEKFLKDNGSKNKKGEKIIAKN